MSQSLSFLLVHIVFSTKDRFAFLRDDVRDELHAYLATIVRSEGCECFRVGGVADHIHLAVRISRAQAVSELVKTLKVSSSAWLKTKSPSLAKFAWQRGYGAFSVGPTDRDALIRYIATQEEHHRKQSFQDEMRGFLRRYGVEFDEQYMWD